MSIRSSYIAALLILAGFFSSCNRTADYEIIDIDSGINIKMVEIFDESPRRLELHCATMRSYPNLCYGLNGEHRLSSNSIDITFKNIIRRKGMCLDAIGTADARINLGAISSGTFSLNLTLHGETYRGELIVSSESYQINFNDNSDFQFSNNPLRKIPENTIWGRIGYNDTEGLTFANTFIIALLGLGAIEQKFVHGNYGEFEIGENGQIVQPINYNDYEYIDGILFDKNGNTVLPINVNNTGRAFVQSFILYFSGNFTDVEQLARQYVRDYGDYLSIRLFSDKGEKYFGFRE